jgi:hypothetical protein
MIGAAAQTKLGAFLKEKGHGLETAAVENSDEAKVQT